MSDFANLLSVITYVHNYRFCPSGPISNSAQSPVKMSDYPPLHTIGIKEELLRPDIVPNLVFISVETHEYFFLF